MNRLLLESRASIRATEVEARAKAARFILSSRGTRANHCRAGKMNNAPLLIRLVRHPFRLRRAYFYRTDLEYAKPPVDLRESFGVRRTLDARSSFESGSPVGRRARAESPARVTAEAWLKQEDLRV